MNPVIDLSENLTGRPGNIVVPGWLACALARACGGAPARNFSREFPDAAIAVGMAPADFELLPYLLADWKAQVEADGRLTSATTAATTSPLRLRIDAVSLRDSLPPGLAERVDSLCARLFGLRLVTGGAGAAEPFFMDETVENLDPGTYAATLSVRPGMLPRLLGTGEGIPAIVVPRRLWDELPAMERGWLIVVEAAARWKFSWIRQDGCVETEVALAQGEALADALKPLAALGRKLVDHGWLASTVDDAPVLFEAHSAASGLRLIWSLHPSRATNSRPAQVAVPVLPVVAEQVRAPEKVRVTEPQPETVQDALLSKMRLVAAEELKKLKTGAPGQYAQLKQRYLESLDPQGRQLIRNLEQMLAAELLEEHLRHGIVRYMIEHPSAWQSATSGKHAH
jgi:hypothetical protein